MDIDELSRTIMQAIPDARCGLGKNLFHAISRLTPVVNVDLLVQKHINNRKCTLLSWREDDFYTGWHLPGGVLRFKEELISRVTKVAEEELHSAVTHIQGPIAINEIMNSERDIRGHFISFLYSVKLNFNSDRQPITLSHELSPGTLKWFDSPPTDLIRQHNIYKGYF